VKGVVRVKRVHPEGRVGERQVLLFVGGVSYLVPYNAGEKIPGCVPHIIGRID